MYLEQTDTGLVIPGLDLSQNFYARAISSSKPCIFLYFYFTVAGREYLICDAMAPD
jgi:hypothetical protein